MPFLKFGLGSRNPKRKHVVRWLEFDGHQIKVTAKAMKSVRLKVDLSSQTISVSCPFEFSDAAILNFLKQKRGWLEKQLTKPSPISEKLLYQPGEPVPLWGRPHELRIETGKKPSIELGNDHLVLTERCGSPLQSREKAVYSFYRQELILASRQLLEDWQPKLGVTTQFLGIKNMKTKWGSCNVQRARVWLNLALAKYPPECLEMVLVHELVHLLEPNHSPRFYQLMDTYLPDWRKADQLLQQPPSTP